MTRKRSRRTRFLPEYVTSFRDRHGKERLRFRRKGYPSRYFTALLGTEAFREEWRRFNDPEAVDASIVPAAAKGITPGTIDDLKERYYKVPSRLGPTLTTQSKVTSVLNRGFFDGRGDRPVRSIRFDHIEAILSKRRTRFKNPDTGRWEGGVESARKLRKELVRLFAFAEKAGMIDRSPMDHVDEVKVAPDERSTGYHTWTEDEIGIYRAHHPIASKARLAMELILWTDQRGIDSVHLGRQHIKGGRFEITQSKTGKLLVLPIAPQLLAAIVSMPPAGASMCFLVNEHGVPFSRKGFGNKFRDWCDEAGLPHCSAHGLRKATLRRMAELKMPNKSMKAVSGHSKDDEIARYVAAADQARLAQEALAQLSQWESSPPEERIDPMAQSAVDAIKAWEAKG